MAGIYIHIPFCKQACYYCNFHFATSLHYKNDLVSALLKEIDLQKGYLENETIDTIYFGGGTPSLFEIDEVQSIITKIYSLYNVFPNAEVTLETNPDDITNEKLNGWKENGINRLSIGVQSFFEEDLQWMNRAHNAIQAKQSIELAQQSGFNNISIDLIYGMPFLSNERWKDNVDTAIAFNIPHLSCYALTVEPKTPLQKMIASHKTEDINPGKQSEQFLLLMSWLEETGYEHYEISNFAKPGLRSRHNASYWSGKKYLGIGPSAHSFDGISRQWNISNNNIYIDSINKGIVPFEKEVLSPTQKLNEYIMTSLRTMEGLDLERVESSDPIAIGLEVGSLPTGQAGQEFRGKCQKFIDTGKMILKENKLILTKEGKLFADGIAADLFF
ncbi:MAG: radical SAM family heme chaperone HemW [Bacteroidota bacterium]